MPVYEYKGVTPQGKKVSGVMDGDSLKAARTKLKKEGVVLLDIREGASGHGGMTRQITFGRGRVRLADLASGTRQLATLLSSGLPLMDALGVLVDQEEGAALKAALSTVRDAVREGSSLADALKQEPRAFSNLYVNMVSAGEVSGTLEITLQRLADLLEEQVAFRGKLLAALTYPAIMTLVGVGILFFLFVYVMPRVVGMLTDMRQQLPLITVIVLAVVNFFSSFWWAILMALGGAAYYLRRYVRTAPGRERLDHALLNIPVFGALVRMIAMSRFARTLGTLLQSGVPALTALDIVQNVLGNTVLADAVKRARDNVREGESIADPLRRSGFFPPVVVQMVAVGEKSGELDKMLLKVSDTFDRAVEARITALMSLVEPVIILVMGAIVFIIIVSIMLPIVQMTTSPR